MMQYRDLGREYDDCLPKPPPITKTSIAASDEEQAILRANFAISPSNLYLHRAEAIIKESEILPYVYLNETQKANYIGALATLGRFEDAYSLTGEERFLRILKAIANKGQSCQCQDTETAEMKDGRAQKVTLSRFFRRAQIYVNNSFVDLTECVKCGFQAIK